MPGCRVRVYVTWWRHQMETFSALLAICAGKSPVPGDFPAQRPVTRSFGVFFDLRRNKRLSKQSWGWWFETLSRPLWRHRNGTSHAPNRRHGNRILRSSYHYAYMLIMLITLILDANPNSYNGTISRKTAIWNNDIFINKILGQILNIYQEAMIETCPI